MKVADLRRAVKKYYKGSEFETRLSKGIPVGNAKIDGEIIRRSDGFRIAVEFKRDDDDLVKGLGQLLEAVTRDFHQAILVVSHDRSRRIDTLVFKKIGFGLAEVDKNDNMNFLVQARNVAAFK